MATILTTEEDELTQRKKLDEVIAREKERQAAMRASRAAGIPAPTTLQSAVGSRVVEVPPPVPPVETPKEETKQLATQLASSPQESLKTLREYEKLAKDPRYAAGVPPTTRQELRDAIAEARALYKEEANRNDWLDVAQTLAGAIAQFGAAQQAGDKYISRVGPTPNTDWAARTNRARQDYLESVRQLESEATEDRANWEAAERAKGTAYGREADALKTKAEVQARKEADELRAIRDRESLALKTAKEKEIDTLKERKFEDAQLAAQEKELQAKAAAASTLGNMLMQEGSASKEVRKANERQYAKLAGQVGIDEQTLADIKEQTKGGWFTSEDKAKKQQLIRQEMLDPIRARLEEIRQQRAALRGAPGQAPAAPVQSTSGTVRIQAPDGTIAEVPADKAQKYIAKGGKVVQ